MSCGLSKVHDAVAASRNRERSTEADVPPACIQDTPKRKVCQEPTCHQLNVRTDRGVALHSRTHWSGSQSGATACGVFVEDYPVCNI
mmetsp:Transcript_16779/g.47912  ORF Transcript_16779/g.47912 Transcript_16779/m.47912 type:complete len:87 (-) Transcript_16779:1066-1326(-)